MKAKKTVSMKMVVLLLTLVLVLGCAAGGTFAWLITQTGPVTNTFTVGDINIELKEHELEENGTLGTIEVTEEDEYKVLPGTEQPKDPFVRVKAGSEDCYVFVKIVEENNSATVDGKAVTYVEWAIASGWTPLDGVAGVYYREYAADADADDDTEYFVLDDNKVSYSQDLTKAALGELNGNKPSLIFTAYAVQKEGMDSVTEAWTAANS